MKSMFQERKEIEEARRRGELQPTAKISAPPSRWEDDAETPTPGKYAIPEPDGNGHHAPVRRGRPPGIRNRAAQNGSPSPGLNPKKLARTREPAPIPSVKLNIEKGVPLPPRNSDRLAFWKTAASEFEPGDSTFFKDERQAVALKKAISGVWGKGSAAMRKENDGFRVWRLK